MSLRSYARLSRFAIILSDKFDKYLSLQICKCAPLTQATSITSVSQPSPKCQTWASLLDDLPPVERIAPPGEERFLDDEADAAADRQQMQKAGAGLRRAHAITRDDDDLLPSF